MAVVTSLSVLLHLGKDGKHIIRNQHVFPRSHGHRSFLKMVVTLFTISSPNSHFLFLSLLFSPLPLHTRSPFLHSPSFSSIAWLFHQVITSHSFVNLRLRQDGSLDAFQVASGYGHHSGDHGRCLGWYVS